MALLVASALLFTGNAASVPAYAQDTHAGPMSAQGLPSVLSGNLGEIRIPEKIGLIEDSFSAEGNGAVILIQDAHDIPEAQKNIHNLIRYFQKNFGVRKIAVEGASTRLDPQIFRSFPDKTILREIFRQYLGAGELTGPSLAAVFAGEPGEYHGVEDQALYEEGYRYYLEALGRINRLGEFLAEMGTSLEGEKERVYAADLKQLDQSLDSFYRNQADLGDLIKLLASFKPAPMGSEVAVFQQILAEPDAAREFLDREIRKVARDFEAYFRGRQDSLSVKAEAAAFWRKLQEFQTGRLEAGDFGLFLAGLSRDDSVRTGFSPSLRRAMKLRSKIRDIEGSRFFRDLEGYAASVKDGLFRSEHERLLDQTSSDLRLIGKMARMELTFGEWCRIKLLHEKALAGKDVPAGAYEAKVRELLLGDELAPHFSFYRNAENRDEVMYLNAVDLLGREPANPGDGQDKDRVVILVSGGFHTEGLKAKLEAQKISYAVLRPAITSLPAESLYREHMQGNFSWRKYFRDENGTVNIYSAFVRDARDRLLAARPAGSGIVLKQWRDQIVRDLAADGRVAEAGVYTRFLDEMTQDQAAVFRNAVLERAEKFIRGLRFLEAGQKLTAEHILRLLHSSQMVSPAAGQLARTQNYPFPRTAGRGDPARAELRLEPKGRVETQDPTAEARSFADLADVSAEVLEEAARRNIEEEDGFFYRGMHLTPGRALRMLEYGRLMRVGDSAPGVIYVARTPEYAAWYGWDESGGEIPEGERPYLFAISEDGIDWEEDEDTDEILFTGGDIPFDRIEKVWEFRHGHYHLIYDGGSVLLSRRTRRAYTDLWLRGSRETDEDLQTGAPRAELRASAENRIAIDLWEQIVKAELEFHDPKIANKREGYMPRLYHILEATLRNIQEKIDREEIFPDAFLKTYLYRDEQDPLPERRPDRPLRVGFLPLAGNPINWGHILIALIAMDRLSLDTVIFRVQGEIKYKRVPKSDQVPPDERHELTQAVLKDYFPLLRYTDVGLKDDHEGTEALMEYANQLVPDQPMDIFYILGSETEDRVIHYRDILYEVLNQYRLPESHRIHWTLMQRGEFGRTLTQEQAEVIMREGAEKFGFETPVPVHVLSGRDVDLNIASTYYREGGDEATVPRRVHEFGVKHQYWGNRLTEDGKFIERVDAFRSDLGPVVREIGDVILRVRAQKPEGRRFSIFAFDGPSGAGKSTVVEEVRKYLEQLGYRVYHLGLDCFLKDRWWRTKIERFFTGEDIDPEGRIEAGVYLGEAGFFRDDEIVDLYREILDFRTSKDETRKFLIRNAYQRVPGEGSLVVPELPFPLHQDEILLIDGKYAQYYQVPGFYDASFRIQDNPGRNIALFQKRARGMHPDDEPRQIVFYERALQPSYELYARNTAHLIDYEINLTREFFELIRHPAQKSRAELRSSVFPANVPMNLWQDIVRERSLLYQINQSIWRPAISVFGSARFPEGHEYYEHGRAIGREIFNAGELVKNGAAFGAMEAASRGFVEAMNEQGIEITPESGPQGVQILIPHEQTASPFTPFPVAYERFLTRKEALHSNMKGAIVLPGGFGTLDEIFEVWRRGRQFVFVETGYWRPIMEAFEQAWARSVPPEDIARRSKLVWSGGAVDAVEYARQGEPYLIDFAKLAVMNDELWQKLTHLYRLPKSVVFAGRPNFAGPEMALGRKLAEGIAKTLGVPVRATNRRELIEGLHQQASEGEWLGNLQGMFFISERSRPVTEEEKKLGDNLILMNFESNHQLLTASNTYAYVFLPGGVGTMNRLFEILTVMQTRKLVQKPVYLVGREFWQPIFDAIRRAMLEREDGLRLISPEDMNLVRIIGEEDLPSVMREIGDLVDLSRAELRGDEGEPFWAGVIREILAPQIHEFPVELEALKSVAQQTREFKLLAIAFLLSLETNGARLAAARLIRERGWIQDRHLAAVVESLKVRKAHDYEADVFRERTGRELNEENLKAAVFEFLGDRERLFDYLNDAVDLGFASEPAKNYAETVTSLLRVLVKLDFIPADNGRPARFKINLAGEEFTVANEEELVPVLRRLGVDYGSFASLFQMRYYMGMVRASSGDIEALAKGLNYVLGRGHVLPPGVIEDRGSFALGVLRDVFWKTSRAYWTYELATSMALTFGGGAGVENAYSALFSSLAMLSSKVIELEGYKELGLIRLAGIAGGEDMAAFIDKLGNFSRVLHQSFRAGADGKVTGIAVSEKLEQAHRELHAAVQRVDQHQSLHHFSSRGSPFRSELHPRLQDSDTVRSSDLVGPRSELRQEGGTEESDAVSAEVPVRMLDDPWHRVAIDSIRTSFDITLPNLQEIQARFYEIFGLHQRGVRPSGQGGDSIIIPGDHSGMALSPSGSDIQNQDDLVRAIFRFLKGKNVRDYFGSIAAQLPLKGGGERVRSKIAQIPDYLGEILEQAFMLELLELVKVLSLGSGSLHENSGMVSEVGLMVARQGEEIIRAMDLPESVAPAVESILVRPFIEELVFRLLIPMGLAIASGISMEDAQIISNRLFAEGHRQYDEAGRMIIHSRGRMLIVSAAKASVLGSFAAHAMQNLAVAFTQIRLQAEQDPGIGPSERSEVRAVEVSADRAPGILQADSRPDQFKPGRADKKFRDLLRQWRRVLKRLHEINQIRKNHQLAPVVLETSFANFAHVESSASGLPPLSGSLLDTLYGGVVLAGYELPPRAVGEYERDADQAIVAEKNSFWRKILETAHRLDAPAQFGVDASKEIRNGMQRMVRGLTGMGYEENDQTRIGVMLTGDTVSLESLGGRRGEMLAEPVFLDRLQLSQKEQEQLRADRLLFLAKGRNPWSGHEIILFYPPDSSIFETLNRIKLKYGIEFDKLGIEDRVIDFLVIRQFLIKALVPLRDMTQLEMTGDHIARFLRDADPLALPEVIRHKHTGGIMHYGDLRLIENEIRAALAQEGLDADLLRTGPVFDDPRLGSSFDHGQIQFAADRREGILENARIIDGELVLNPAYFTDLFGENMNSNPLFRKEVSDAVMTFAREYVRKGDLARAVAIARDSLRFAPESFEAWSFLGLIQERQGRTDEAVIAYTKAASLNPESAVAWYLLARIQDKQGLPDKAEKSAFKSYQLDPEFSELLEWLRLFYLEKGRVAEALDFFQKAVRNTPLNPEAWNSLGILFFKQNDSRAESMFSRAAEISPQNPKYWNNLGLLFYHRGQIVRAVAAFRKALEVDPQYLPAKKNLAVFYSRHGEVTGFNATGLPLGVTDASATAEGQKESRIIVTGGGFERSEIRRETDVSRTGKHLRTGGSEIGRGTDVSRTGKHLRTGGSEIRGKKPFETGRYGDGLQGRPGTVLDRPDQGRFELREGETADDYRARVLMPRILAYAEGVPEFRSVPIQTAQNLLEEFWESMLQASDAAGIRDAAGDIEPILHPSFKTAMEENLAGASETDLMLDGGVPVKVLRMPASEDKRSGFLLLKVQEPEGMPGLFVGYMGYQVNDKDIGIGIQIFKPYRSGLHPDVRFSSRELYHAAKGILLRTTGISLFRLHEDSQILNSPGEDPLLNALFQIKSGFYPPSRKDEADAVLLAVVEAPGALDDVALRALVQPVFDPAATYLNMWEFPLPIQGGAIAHGRHEIRSGPIDRDPGDFFIDLNQVEGPDYWRREFPDKEIHLYVGSGDGRNMGRLATANPGAVILGVDLDLSRGSSLPSEANELQNNLREYLRSRNAEVPANMRFVRTDVRQLVSRSLDEGQLSRVYIFFPYTSPGAVPEYLRSDELEFWQDLISRLKPGAAIHLVTDDSGYAAALKRLIGGSLEGTAEYREVPLSEMPAEFPRDFVGVSKWSKDVKTYAVITRKAGPDVSADGAARSAAGVLLGWEDASFETAEDIRQEVTVLGVDGFAGELRSEVRLALDLIEDRIRDQEIMVSRQQAQIAIDRFIRVMETKLTGSLAVGFNVTQGTASLFDALKEKGVSSRIGLALFPRGMRDADETLRGLVPRQFVSQFSRYRVPTLYDNRESLPVVGEESSAAQGLINPAVQFFVGVQPRGIYHEPFLEVAEKVLQIAAALLVADQKISAEKLKNPVTRAALRATLLKDLFGNFSARDQAVIFDADGNIAVDRSILKVFITQYLARAETQKAA